MTTYTLKLTPPGGPVTEKHGLSRDQTLRALADIMYGNFEDVVPAAVAAQEAPAALAA
jgi:hypothetical protein